MADKVETRISLTLQPDVYREVEGYEQHAQFVGCVVNAVNDAFVTLGKIHDARRLADSNGAWTEEQKLLNVGRTASEQKARILKKVELAERDLAANIAHTKQLLSEPLMEKAGLGSLNGEVRSYARSLDRAGRSALIRDALASDDEATLSALLGAQPFLSGLTKVDQDHYLYLYHSKRNPHLVARLETMERFREKASQIAPVVHLQFDKAVGAKSTVVEAIKSANDQAEAALKIAPTT